jgi:hypothetical protein
MTRNAEIMSKGHVEELVALARSDLALWELLKDRELEAEKAVADAARQGFHVDDPRAVIEPFKRPSRHELLDALIKQRYGPDENFYHGSFVVAIRKLVREELGLQV